MQFKQLEVWKRSCRLSVNIYKFSNNISDFGFKDQITRSALSIPSNISEGEDRSSLKEAARFLKIAKGSSAELLTQIMIGMKAEFIPKAIGSNWLKEVEDINKMLAGLIKKKEAS